MRHLKSEIRKGDTFDWVSNLLRPSRVSRSGQSPVRHLLLIQALGYSAESFFKFVTEPHPFRGSLPGGREEGTDTAKASLEKSIADCWPDLSVSRNEMCRKLDISTHKLNAIASRLGLPFPRGGAWGSKMVGAGSMATAIEILTSKRDAFTALRGKHRELGMKELQKLAPALIRWLRSHDREWLIAHRPTRLQRGGAPRLNWAHRDAMCVERIPSALRDLASAERRPSIAAIERELRVRIDANGDRMPKTMELLRQIKRRTGMASK